MEYKNQNNKQQAIMAPVTKALANFDKHCFVCKKFIQLRLNSKALGAYEIYKALLDTNVVYLLDLLQLSQYYDIHH